jgi:beta-glucanase (GH16 family)
LKSSTGSITSGRIYSQNKQSFQWGRMEARMRLPVTQGYWPAFWMLGTTGGWPSCGEIDIMEGKGAQPTWTSGSFHSSQGTPVQTKSYTMPAGTGNVHDSFHIYAVDWSADSIRWFFDNVCFETLTVSAHPGIPLSNNFYFLLNVAVGGNFGGNYNTTTVFPESLIVDYVRVYHWDPTVGIATARTIQNKSGFSIQKIGRNFTVTLPLEQRYTLDLFSVEGKKVMTQAGIAKTFGILTTALSPGVYTAVVKGALGTFCDRILVRP